MDKPNTNSEKTFDSNNEKLPQVKIPDLAIILYLHYCSKVIIRQYSNLKKNIVQPI